MGTLVDLFGFPNGSVLTNLIASLIWAPLAAMVAFWRAKVHFGRKLAEHRDEMHARHDAHEQALADLHAKVDAIHAERQHAPIGSLPDGTPVHIDGKRLYQEIQRQTLRDRRRNPGFGGPVG